MFFICLLKNVVYSGVLVITYSSESNKFIDKTMVNLDMDENDPRLGVRVLEFDNSTSEKIVFW